MEVLARTDQSDGFLHLWEVFRAKVRRLHGSRIIENIMHLVIFLAIRTLREMVDFGRICSGFSR
jgi:hypothetical protein